MRAARRMLGLSLAITLSLVSLPVSGDETYVYVATPERALLRDARRDDLLKTNLVEPALRLATANRYVFSVKCDQPTCSIADLVTKHFGYYPGKFKESAAAIRRWVVNDNRLVSDVIPRNRSIDLPAVPIKANETFRLAGVRVYTPATQMYVIGDGADNLNKLATAREPIHDNDERRASNELLTRYDSLADFRKAYPHGAPPGATVFIAGRDPSTTKRVRLHLFGEEAERLPAYVSPYRDAWLEQWRSEETMAIDELLRARASDHPFVIIDWDFAEGHGCRVLTVARESLAAFDVSFLRIESVDLNPAINRDGLKALLSQYCRDKSLRCESTVGEEHSRIQTQYAEAMRWIDTDPPASDEDLEVDGLVMTAALWTAFHAGAMTNLSFRITPVEAQVMFEPVIEASAGMAFVAAGNDPEALRASYFPQNLARSWPGRFVNVTFGSPDGGVEGAYSMRSSKERTDVALVAQGSGFPYPDLAGRRGSSYAAPVVTAAAWVRYLLDETADNDKFLPLLIQASRPAPSMSVPIGSGGFFDPYLLLLKDEKYALAADGEIHRLCGGSIDYTYYDEVAQIVKNDRLVLSGPYRGMVRVLRSGNDFELWSRRIDEAGDATVTLQKQVSLRANICMEGINQMTMDEAAFADKLLEVRY